MAPARPDAARYPELQSILTKANQRFAAQDYNAALAIYKRGLSVTPDGVPHYRGVFLLGEGNCEGMLRRDEEALHSFNEAIETATRHGLNDILWKASVGRVSLYRRLPTMETARVSVQQDERTLLASGQPWAIVQLANVVRDTDFEKSLLLFRAAVLAAQTGFDDKVIALIWNQMGHACLLNENTDCAEPALTEAFRLRWMVDRKHMQPTYFYLGWLRRLQGRYEEARRLLIQARRLSGEPGGVFPFSIDRELARAAAGAGDRKAALAWYESSVRLAEDSRILALQPETYRTAAEEGLHTIFSEYVQLGMSEYDETKDLHLATRMFALAVASRNSLFQASVRSPVTLPRVYLTKLAEFRSALAQSLSVSDATAQKRLSLLRLELANTELEIGIRREKNSPQIFEKVGSGNPLKGIQRNLRDSEALLSFMVAPSSSFVWAVTRDSFEVHRLPGAPVLAGHIREYRRLLESKQPEAERQGRTVVSELMSAFSEQVHSRRDWILSLDAPLYDLPFASLPEPSGAPGRRLGQQHSLRITPAAPEGGESAPRRVSAHFAGQADPVYNPADPRLGGSTRPVRADGGEPFLQRLPGSARELKKCAAAWKADPSPEVLTGVETGREALMRQLADNPAVLHLGMHVVSHPLAPDQVLVALGRRANGEPDYLTPLEIARWRHPVGLVTLSGCSSGTGQARQGLGMFGLTRAWLVAGAEAVVASYWPIRDDDGQLLADLYAELSKQGGRTGPLEVARALQYAQNESALRADWQSVPSYWAAFFVVGKE